MVAGSTNDQMTGYTRHWDCRICLDPQETMDYPNTPVCERCLRPVAERMCANVRGQTLMGEGIDVDYWMAKASRLVLVLMQRWKQRPPEDVAKSAVVSRPLNMPVKAAPDICSGCGKPIQPGQMWVPSTGRHVGH
jgi:hypothetical protein